MATLMQNHGASSEGLALKTEKKIVEADCCDNFLIGSYR